MNATEMLITVYDDDAVVLVANLTPEAAKTVLTSTDADGETTVESTVERATEAFATVRRVVAELSDSA